MSSRRKRRRREEMRRESFSNNTPFGINPSQLMGLFGNNVDFNQIGNMLSSMNMDGIDLNNFNINNQASNKVNKQSFDLGPLQGLMNGLGLGTIGSNMSNVVNDSSSDTVQKEFIEENINIDEHINNVEDDVSVDFQEEEEFLVEDENIQMLIAIKSIVDPKKADFLQRVIEEYNKGSFK